MRIKSLLERLRTLLILGRVSNLPTVWSNLIVGWALGEGDINGASANSPSAVFANRWRVGLLSRPISTTIDLRAMPPLPFHHPELVEGSVLPHS